jgi:type IV secretory pathway VirD2 relaxase
MLSPHPEHQDATHQLDLKAWTQQMMLQLEQDFGRRVDWFAVSHEHPEHRHVHVVAVSKQRLGVNQFRSMREAGDSNVVGQQRKQARQPGKGDKPLETARSQDRRRDREVSGQASRQQPVDNGISSGPRRAGPLFGGDR